LKTLDIYLGETRESIFEKTGESILKTLEIYVGETGDLCWRHWRIHFEETLCWRDYGSILKRLENPF